MALFGALLLGATGALTAAPVGAQASDPPPGPTYIECGDRPTTGQFHRVVPAGPGKVWVSGQIRPCRAPSPNDAALIAEMQEEVGVQAGGPSVVYYKRAPSGRFSRVVTLSTDTRRVCLADTPESAVDCFAVRVPDRGGKPGVPIVQGRTTTADVYIPPSYGLCGFCW